MGSVKLERILLEENMSFADWKKRSKLYQTFKSRAERFGIGYDEVAQAAYKAGERDGRKQAETVAEQAIKLRELMRSSVEIRGG